MVFEKQVVSHGSGLSRQVLLYKSHGWSNFVHPLCIGHSDEEFFSVCTSIYQVDITTGNV